MPDSEPIHDNPRNTRNLPAVVPQGELGRSASDNWLLRAIRNLFGWKANSVRDDRGQVAHIARIVMGRL